mmetsp:Transcript_10333/g.30232  ORF Transcript_10333/g.30232 Transcript_10333/m.30232 type:complete len:305 (+) Transcript_10333:2159-3073(+)
MADLLQLAQITVPFGQQVDATDFHRGFRRLSRRISKIIDIDKGIDFVCFPRRGISLFVNVGSTRASGGGIVRIAGSIRASGVGIIHAAFRNALAGKRSRNLLPFLLFFELVGVDERGRCQRTGLFLVLVAVFFVGVLVFAAGKDASVVGSFVVEDGCQLTLFLALLGLYACRIELSYERSFFHYRNRTGVVGSALERALHLNDLFPEGECLDFVGNGRNIAVKANAIAVLGVLAEALHLETKIFALGRGRRCERRRGLDQQRHVVVVFSLHAHFSKATGFHGAHDAIPPRHDESLVGSVIRNLW